MQLDSIGVCVHSQITDKYIHDNLVCKRDFIYFSQWQDWLTVIKPVPRFLGFTGRGTFS